jgi:hypothetical protein
MSQGYSNYPWEIFFQAKKATSPEREINSSHKYSNSWSQPLHSSSYFKPKTCFLCNREGHIARDCFYTTSGEESMLRFRPKTCFLCKQTGHIAKDCHKIRISQENKWNGHSPDRDIISEHDASDSCYQLSDVKQTLLYRFDSLDPISSVDKSHDSIEILLNSHSSPFRRSRSRSRSRSRASDRRKEKDTRAWESGKLHAGYNVSYL